MKPDRLIVFRGVDGDWRWHRRRSHTIGMALALHEWATEVHIADGRDAGKTIGRRA